MMNDEWRKREETNFNIGFEIGHLEKNKSLLKLKPLDVF